MLREPVPAPERPDPGLRVELRRRQPARPRVGDAVPLPRRAGPAGARISTSSSGSFHELLLNFTWWVNRKDRSGKNVFEGGFLGLDNIGVFDRSAPLPTGGYLEQADGTAWMAFFCQNMLEIAHRAGRRATRATRTCVQVRPSTSSGSPRRWTASATTTTSMWDEEDGFYYDVLRLPDGQRQRLKVRSMVGLLPLCASDGLRAGQR